jgi:16S rRNA (guanine1207-N2)-methyltransferase
MNHPPETGERPSEHYFTAQPSAVSAPKTVPVSVRGLSLALQTDAGVFARGAVDRGSRLLAAGVQLQPGARVLDWGAGYGFLGLVLALLYPDSQVDLVEINERAVDLARQNLARYEAGNAQVICGEAPGVLGEQSYDAIVSNPPFRAGREAVEELIADAGQRLTPGGELWLVVPTNKGAKRFLQFMNEHFFETRTVAISGGYRVLWAKRATAD